VPGLEPIDLHHQGAERVIGVYLVETDDGLALFDCGPTTCVDALENGLHARGVELGDLRHLLLSHIHLDHAGAAGVLVRRNPGLQVHVSPIGADHLIDPTRLEASARRLYGDTFDSLWGELAPIPAGNVHAVGDRVVGLECFPSPGHASHHVCYVDGDVLYAGDSVGVRIQPARHILPVAPPPDVDLDAWHHTLDEIERRRLDQLALIHFGVVTQPRDHLRRMRRELMVWAERVRAGADEDEFVAAARNELEEAEGAGASDLWELAAPFWQSHAGLRRYWDKRLAA
jgi:glyoxylase-like metal-dependent hydrolase (beta-lactamase superfamily II)